MTVLENLRKEYPYLYETHLHTSEASSCACSTGKEMAQACKDAGYTGIIVPNHNGLDVFFGYEAGYQGTEFLVYGITLEWLIAHPEIENATIEEQYEWIHEAGGMVIHAHPFREEPYIPEIRLFPEYVDGVEGINATHSSPKSRSHNNPDFDKKAIAYATKYHLPMTAGSDIHNTALFGGGVAFRRKLKDIHDYCDAIRGGEDYILTNGENWYTKEGKQLY